MALSREGLIAKLDATSRLALEEAAKLCVARTHYEVDLEHYLQKLTIPSLWRGQVQLIPGAGHAPNVERPDEMMAGKQVEHIVQTAILELEPTFRECLVLRDVEDLSYEEIGAITGLPEGTVKSRIHRARAQLKELGAKVAELRRLL